MNMRWKLLQGGLLLLLCDLLTVAEAEKEKNIEDHVTRGEVKVPPLALRHLAEPMTTTQHNDSATDDLEERVKLPSMECSHNQECRLYSTTLPLECYDGQCRCRPPQCWVYQYIVTGTFTAKNEFSCGECGILGSSCNATIQCDSPGECWSDGYCHCPNGENYSGVCLTSNLNWTNTLAFSAMGAVFFIAMCVLAVNCYKQPPWRNSEAWRCRCCRAVVGGRVSNSLQGRRGSCEKTPAFTIQAHYASQDLASPPEDVPGASPNGPGGAVPRRPRIPSTSSGTTFSISSANTNMTTMSGSVSGYSTARNSPPPSPPPPPPHPPPPPAQPLSHSFSRSSPSNPSLPSPLTPSPSTSLLPPPLSSSSAASALPHTPSSPPAHPPPPYVPLPQDSSNSRNVNGGRETDSSSMKPTEVHPESSNLRPSTSKSSSEIASTSSGASGGCTHERCQLCLPRAPASHITAPPRRRTSDRLNMNGKRSLLPQTDSSHAGNSIELTQL